MKRLVAKYKHERACPGRPVIVITPGMVNKVHVVVMAHRQVTERYIASKVEISYEREQSILMKIWQ